MGRRHHRGRGHHNMTTKSWLMLIIALAILGALAFLAVAFLPLIIAAGIGYGIYHYAKKAQKNLPVKEQVARLQANIKATDQELKQLKTYQNQEQGQAYQQLAQKVLPVLATIDQDSRRLKGQIDPEVYDRIQKRVQTERDLIAQTLESLSAPAPENLTQEERVARLAPELLDTYTNIKTDDRLIQDKLTTAANRAELTALHAANMNRFEDILDGYLKIKAAPKDYHKAQERLNLAKTALEEFDRQLDRTLQELNEADLGDFDISLRLMQQQETHHDI